MTIHENAVFEVDSIFRVGEVIGVKGRTVQIRVDKAKNGSHLLYRGQLLRNVSVGGYLKIAKGFSELIAIVDGEAVKEASGDEGYRSRRDRVDRVLTVSLVGFFTGTRFDRGVRELPLIGNEAFLLTEQEFDQIHSFVGANDRALTVGRLATEKEQRVRVGVNTLFASHIGIFGNTGSGKSYTLAKLYHELFSTYRDSERFRQRARVLIIDFNGEYVNDTGASPDGPSGSVIIEDDLKHEFVLSTRDGNADKLPFTRQALEDPAIWTVLLDATEKTQAPFVTRTLLKPYWDYCLADGEQLADAIGVIVFDAIKSGDPLLEKSLIVRFLEEISDCLSDATNGGLVDYVSELQRGLGYHSQARCYIYRTPQSTYYANEPSNDAFFRELTIGRLGTTGLDPSALHGVDRVRAKLVLQYYSDIFRGYANREHLGPLLKRLETRAARIKHVIEESDEPFLNRPLTVVCLRGVSLEMRKILPLLICRQLYDIKKAAQDGPRYLNIVIDEAHNILSSVSSRESEAWKDYRLETFEEIIKEGRKFGVFLTIASQRPHDISETIISQLHNYFLHRLVNNLDIQAVERAVSYLDRVSFESLPILPTGSCVLSGMSTQVPLVVDVDPLAPKYEPNNRTMTLDDDWTEGPDIFDDPPDWYDDPAPF